ncbi:MAG: hypothetical protein HS108_03825 [Planctomycetes bacterium]|jgi:hypothetical protein|nr:hypothetical protein [Planctomycetota bacterium]MCL4729317.1 hypothetical protein [Planctomycetota bacterium]
MATAFDLRPLQFGDHLGRSSALFMRHWVSLARWYNLTFFVPMVAVVLGLNLLLDPYAWQEHRMAEPSVLDPNATAAYWWLTRLCAVALAHWFAAGGVLYIASRLYVGDNPGLAETARAVFQRGGHLTATMLVYLTGLIGMFLLCLGPAWLIGQGTGRNAEVQAWMFVAFVSIPGLFFLLVLFLGRYGLAPACVMLDDADSASAFSRSAVLARGFRWRLAMLVLITGLLTGVPGLWSLTGVPGQVGRVLLADAGHPVWGDLLLLAWQGLLGPVVLLPTVVFFFDQRCRKEGYDLAVMARNFGIDDAQLLRFQMDPMLGYIPKGYKHPPGRRMAPPQPVPPAVMQPQTSRPWQTPAAARPQPRVFRPPTPRGGR